MTTVKDQVAMISTQNKGNTADLCIVASQQWDLGGVKLGGQGQGLRPVLQVLAHLQCCRGARAVQEQLLQFATQLFLHLSLR